MTKQEIDNLKVGDWFADDELHYFEIIAIIPTGYGYRNYICKSKDFAYKLCISENQVEEMTIFNKQPKKIPYTIETFPENALWIRNYKCAGERLKFKLYKRDFRFDFIEFDGINAELKGLDYLKDFEIGCQVIKDGKIEIEWLPFYREE